MVYLLVWIGFETGFEFPSGIMSNPRTYTVIYSVIWIMFVLVLIVKFLLSIGFCPSCFHFSCKKQPSEVLDTKIINEVTDDGRRIQRMAEIVQTTRICTRCGCAWYLKKIKKH